MPGPASGQGAAIRPPRITVGAPIRLPRDRAAGGARSRRRRQPRAQGTIPVKSLLAGTLAFLRVLPDQRWLDRLVRSRWWIPVLGVMLTAIVGMQVEVLKSGAGTGRSINLATRLESSNQLLSASVAELDSPQRIEQVASQMGMVMAGPTSIQFAHAAAPGSVRAAIAGISTPDSQSFMATLMAAQGTATASGASVSAGGTNDSGTSGGTSVTAAPASSLQSGATGVATSSTAASTSGSTYVPPGAPGGSVTGASVTGAPATGAGDTAATGAGDTSATGAGDTSATGTGGPSATGAAALG